VCRSPCCNKRADVILLISEWGFHSLEAHKGEPPAGVEMGMDLLSGGSFYADPHGWVLEDSVPVTNPTGPPRSNRSCPRSSRWVTRRSGSPCCA
jgi:hypothetical protein